MSTSLGLEWQRIVEDELALFAGARAHLAGEASPYFAHMRIETRGRVRDVLLGWKTITEGDVTVLHWQQAPLAEVFFSTAEGQDYEIDVAGRTVEGQLLARSLLGFDGGELVEITTKGVVLTRGTDGTWREARREALEILHARTPEERTRGISAIEVPLDAEQRAAVDRPRGTALLVLGEAGCGKTTVALHRVQKLAREAQHEGHKFRGAVIVPTEGLRRLSAALLERMRVGGVETWTYDRWAAAQARDAFDRIPLRESQDAPAGVVHVKRHRALGTALRELARQPPARDEDDPVAKLGASRTDLLHLFGDRALLDRVAAASNGAIQPRMIAETLEHTHVQFSQTAEQEYSHVAADRLDAVDGRALDAGTPMEDAGTIDVEDYAVLFELSRLRAQGDRRRLAQPARYDCIALDEAQEFAPLELALVGLARTAGGTLVVAGDAGQQVDPTACFADWNATMHDLGANDHAVATLATSYRCPPDVTAFARSILAGNSPPNRAPGDSPTLVFRHYANECHQQYALIEALRALSASDPEATVAVVLRTPEAAKRHAALLGRGVPCHLALEGDFRFAPGVQVTCVGEVKGLEFDFVIVPDASSSVYPAEPDARRALYVAVTRTMQQLVVSAVGSWSTLVV